MAREEVPLYEVSTEELARRVRALESEMAAIISKLGTGQYSQEVVSGYLKSPNFKSGVSGWQIDGEGNAEFQSIVARGTISGRSTDVIAAAIDASGHFIDTALDTSTKRILGDFTFGESGAIKMITDADNGLWISPTGILGKKEGATTFAIDTSGDAIFAGTLSAATGTLGTITAGTLIGTTITGGVIQTATSGARIAIRGSDNTLRMFNSSAQVIGLGSESGVAARFNLDGTTNTGILMSGTAATIVGFNYQHTGNVANRAINIDMTGTTGNTLPAIEIEHRGGGEGIFIQKSGTGMGLQIDNSASSYALQILHSHDDASAMEIIYHGRKHALTIESDDSNISTSVLSVQGNATSFSVPIAEFIRTTPGNAIVSIVSDLSTSYNHVGLLIDMKATTTTTPHAISFSGNMVVNDAVSGTQNRKIRVFINGATYYIPAYDS